jgi:hypothetical protein
MESVGCSRGIPSSVACRIVALFWEAIGGR